MAELLPQNHYCQAAPLMPTPMQDNGSNGIRVSVSWVNPDLVLEVQSNPYGTTYSGNSTDKIRCQHEALQGVVGGISSVNASQ